ncbi:unnamed protein product [Orchesella dallaii]|uniref:Activity-regulated cytoskeleton-associated protein n=1 Tax=Orchesella dallaii TaxID=48710 RepID=A0ABP1SB91_9HEXA
MASGQDIIDAINALELKINKAVTDLNTAVLGNTNMLATQATNLSTLQTTVANVTTQLGSISTKIGTAATTHTTSTAHTTGSATASGSGSGSSGTPHTHTHAPTIDVTQGLPFPKYDPTSMTPRAFIAEAEEFLTLKGTALASWHLIVGRMFDPTSDIANWWRAKRTTIASWADFKKDFLAYEDCDASYDMMLNNLYKAKQKFDDPFETFAWNIHMQMHKIDPNVNETLVVDRIVNSCLPEIANEVRQYNCKKVEELVRIARMSINTLNKLRAFEKKPMLRARKTDPLPEAKRFQTSPQKPYLHANGKTDKKDKFQSEKGSFSHETGTDPANKNKMHEKEDALHEGQNQEKPPVQCGYCKRFNNHTHKCRTRQRDEERARKSQQEN